MIAKELKNKAIELRKNGSSYNFIAKEIGVSKSTLSIWFADSDWNSVALTQNKTRNLVESTQRLVRINKEKTLNLADRYKKAEVDAIKEFELFKNDTLFIAGIMLYFGEGDKSKLSGLIRIGNIDAPIIKIFVKFLLKYCNIPINKVKFWLLSYPDLDTDRCLSWWLRELKLSKNNVYKTQIIQGRHKTKRLLYGVGNIILSSKVLKIKILKWVELASKELA